MKLISVVGREEIERKINTIFNVEERSRMNNKRFYYVNVVENDIYQAYVRKMDFELEPEDNFVLQWDTFTTLKQLYISIERVSGCRSTFINIIENKLSGLRLNSALAFYFLLKIGSNDIIIRTLKSKIEKSLTVNNYYDEIRNKSFECGEYKYGKEVDTLLRDIVLFMHLEPSYFDDYFVSQLEEIINYEYEDIYINKKDFENEILSIAYKKLVNELKGSNEELNIHKEAVIEMITKYGFPSDMEIYLLEIDRLPDHMSNWQTINSGMISKLRSFFEELVKSTALKIKTKTNENYPKDKPSEMGKLRAYIKEQLGLSDRDNELIDAFVNVLHKEGGHRLTSDKKHFMLTKNIGIELAYFLLSVYEEKFEQRPV